MPNIKLSQKNISLDLQHIGYVNTIYAQQGDENARELTIYLFDDGKEYLIPKDATVSLCGTRADKTVVYRDVDSVEGNIVKVIFNNTELAAKGTAKYKIEIKTNLGKGETQLLTSTPFNIKVYENIYDEDGKLASPQYSDLQRELEKIHEQEENIEKEEAKRVQAETIRESNESTRKNAETARIEAEKIRETNENTRKNNEQQRQSNEQQRQSNEQQRQINEQQRQSNEQQRQSNEQQRQNNTSTAIENAQAAAKKANDATTDLQNKLDSHHFVLTEDKGVANGVPNLDSNTKIPANELYEATTSRKGITQLTDGVTSTSITTAATPNSVKQTYDAVLTENNRATAAENNLQNTINTNKPIWDDKYTRNEIDNKFSTLETNIDWKEAVNTYADITTTYPNPQDGWTVNVKDNDYTYRYDGSKWVTISANAIPKATNSVDGLLSKEDHTKYEDANSKKHTHDNKSVLDGITSGSVNSWNSAERNIITGVQKNGTDISISSDRKVNIVVPTKVSELTNDSGYKTTDTVYTHPNSGVTAGTYKSVTVNAQGHVTGASNPTTLSGYGITDAANKTHKHTKSEITDFPTSMPASDVYQWAKEVNKPVYTATEVGAAASDHKHSYNDLSGLPTIPTKTSQLTNDSGYLKCITEIYYRTDNDYAPTFVLGHDCLFGLAIVYGATCSSLCGNAKQIIYLERTGYCYLKGAFGSSVKNKFIQVIGFYKES